MKFDFITAPRIIFGPGSIDESGKAAAQFGKRVFVCSGLPRALTKPLFASLEAAGLSYSYFPVAGEPSFASVKEALESAKKMRCDLVVGFGGGSAIDSGKAVAALLANPGDPLEYAEIVGEGKPIANPSIPNISIPTTAGTGAEVTKNAVIAFPEKRVKVSLRSPFMVPRIALIDPELALGLGPDITASTGMDALTQVIEPFVSNKANPMTDAVCREGMARASRSLLRAYRSGSELSAREDMALASLFGGIALANARLGAVHGFAAPIGGMFQAPHGAVCAALLPYAVKANIKALKSRDPESGHLARFRECAGIVCGSVGVEDLVSWLIELQAALGIPSLSAYGLSEEDFPLVIEKAKAASSMQGNPIALNDEELAEILEEAL